MKWTLAVHRTTGELFRVETNLDYILMHLKDAKVMNSVESLTTDLNVVDLARDNLIALFNTSAYKFDESLKAVRQSALDTRMTALECLKEIYQINPDGMKQPTCA